MNIEDFRNYCLLKSGTTEEFPFDETTLVFKVQGKMFALTDVDDAFSVILKCEPQKALELRENYRAVKPGYHMSKKHWNTVVPNEDVPDKLIYQWIDDSYKLVVNKLPRKLRDEL